ncbi:MAG: hypothetical protein AAF684_03975, partial [Pseudomonadota bacterium]
MTGWVRVAAMAAAMLFTATTAAADVVNQSSRGLAIEGYDPVAYFTQQAAVEGDDAFETEWNGATWRFANA